MAGVETNPLVLVEGFLVALLLLNRVSSETLGFGEERSLVTRLSNDDRSHTPKSSPTDYLVTGHVVTSDTMPLVQRDL
jgi:hypothetical protein